MKKTILSSLRILLSLRGERRSRTTKQSLSKTLSLSLGVLAMTLLISVIVMAWTEPSTAPPGGNVDAPLNVGSDEQTKTGDLIVGQAPDGNFLGIGGGAGQDAQWLKNIGGTLEFQDKDGYSSLTIGQDNVISIKGAGNDGKLEIGNSAGSNSELCINDECFTKADLLAGSGGGSYCNDCDYDGHVTYLWCFDEDCISRGDDFDDNNPDSQIPVCDPCYQWNAGTLSCESVSVGTDPKGDCSDGACTTGFCDGSGSCQFTGSGIDDGCPACKFCDGLGSCVDISESCATTNPFCVDGVCCDTACDGTCVACNVAGHEGTCTNIPNGQTDDTCAETHYRCDGEVECTAPISFECIPKTCGSTTTCDNLCVSNGYTAGCLPAPTNGPSCPTGARFNVFCDNAPMSITVGCGNDQAGNYWCAEYDAGACNITVCSCGDYDYD